MNQHARQAEPDDEPGAGGPSDPRAVEGKKKRSEQREQRRLNGLRKILSEQDGRLWLWDLLSFCGISRTSFTGNSTTFFNEGQRNIGLKVQADLTKHFPDDYIKLLKEGEAANA